MNSFPVSRGCSCKVQVEIQRGREGKFPAQESIELMITETPSATADAGPAGRHGAQAAPVPELWCRMENIVSVHLKG